MSITRTPFVGFGLDPLPDTGITYKHYPQGSGPGENAYDYTQGLYDKLDLDFDYGLYDPNSKINRKTKKTLNAPGSSDFVQWNEDEVRENLYLPEQEQYAEQMLNLFDQYVPQAEYVAENAGVSGAELASALGTAGAQYNANQDATMAEATRDMQRMGVNPNSGRYAALSTGNALGKAAGYSATQNQVRQLMDQQNMGERMQAAQLGLGIGAQGASMYGQMGSQLQSSKQFYDQAGEQSRQYDIQAKQSADQMRLQQQSQMTAEAQQRHQYGTQINSSGSTGQFGGPGTYKEWETIGF